MAKLRVGVVGIRRGAAYVRILKAHPGAELVAACNRDPKRYEALQASTNELLDGVDYVTDFDELLRRDIDAVVLANDAHEHASFAIRALRAGKHVLSEIPATPSVSQAVELVETVEETGLVYMMGENCCFMPYATEARRAYQNGELGQLQHADAEYVHDTSSGWEALTRGDPSHWRNVRPSTFHCTHALGPVLYATDTRVERVVAMESPNRAGHAIGRQSGDAGVFMCQLSNGATARILISHGGIKREPSSLWLCLYGTGGTFETDRRVRERVLLFGDAGWTSKNLEDASMALDVHGARSLPDELSEIARRHRSHGGADFYVVHLFLESVAGRWENRLDVYRALDMSLPGLLAQRSITSGNAPVDVPDLRDPSMRNVWRDDPWTATPLWAQ